MSLWWPVLVLLLVAAGLLLRLGARRRQQERQEHEQALLHAHYRGVMTRQRLFFRYLLASQEMENEAERARIERSRWCL